MLNRVTMQGKICGDLKKGKTKDATTAVSITIRCERDYRRPDGLRDADFITVVAYNKLADTAASMLSPGDIITVDGKVESKFVADKKVIQIRADNIHFDRLSHSSLAPDPQESELA